VRSSRPQFRTCAAFGTGVILDKSGLNQNRGIVSLMRYAAMAEGIEFNSMALSRPEAKNLTRCLGLSH
jgi:hypothetical protein